MSRSARLLRLMQVLRGFRNPVSAEILANTMSDHGFKISVRSIYRDVQTLREQGAIISGEAGIGYLLKPGYLLPPLMFDEDELDALVLGLRLVKQHGDKDLARSSNEALSKLRAALPSEKRVLIDEVGLLAVPIFGSKDKIDLAQVRSAIRHQARVRMVYQDQNESFSERTIWPLGLAYLDSRRLLAAYCELRNDYRTFRTDGICEWTPLGDRYQRSRRILLREWSQKQGIPEGAFSG